MDPNGFFFRRLPSGDKNVSLTFFYYNLVFFFTMSKAWKARRADQARKRRAKAKEKLTVLRLKALKPEATTDLRNAYKTAIQKRNKVLEYDKKRAAVRRKNFSSEIAKLTSSAKQDKVVQLDAQGTYQLKNNKLKKMREYQSSRRLKKKFDLIKSKIENEQKDVNKPWVPYKRTLLTPLGAAVKACDLAAVRWVIEKKASIWQTCGGLLDRPLFEAAWDNKSKIVEHLLGCGALEKDCKTHGALHGMIYYKSFSAVKIFLQKGCLLNEYYGNTTPLGVALTCGKNNSGDARLVRRLLAAKADVTQVTKMSQSIYCKGDGMASPIDIAAKFSNKRCFELIQAECKSAEQK